MLELVVCVLLPELSETHSDQRRDFGRCEQALSPFGPVEASVPVGLRPRRLGERTPAKPSVDEPQTFGYFAYGCRGVGAWCATVGRTRRAGFGISIGARWRPWSSP